MSSLPKKILDLPLEERALLALRAAVKQAIAELRREGLPVYVWSNGKVVDISAKKPRARPGFTVDQPGSRIPKNILDLPLEERALLAFKAAVKQAIAELRREGLPVYVWRDGKVVDISAKKPRAKSRHPGKPARARKKH